MLGALPFLLLVLAPLRPDEGTTGGCPNVRACDVPARVDEQGTDQSCGLGITLFGFDIAIGGEVCFPFRYFYPAHQECHGKRNVGTYCAVEGSLNVAMETCECSSLGALGTGIQLPDCTCTARGSGGTITDYKTMNCEAPPEVGGSGGSGGSGG